MTTRVQWTLLMQASFLWPNSLLSFLTWIDKCINAIKLNTEFWNYHYRAMLQEHVNLVKLVPTSNHRTLIKTSTSSSSMGIGNAFPSSCSCSAGDVFDVSVCCVLIAACTCASKVARWLRQPWRRTARRRMAWLRALLRLPPLLTRALIWRRARP